MTYPCSVPALVDDITVDVAVVGGGIAGASVAWELASSGRLVALEPDARILPFMECPNAAARAKDLIGAPLADLRAVVLDRLAKTNGCTHLNDALRALAEVPVLFAALEAGFAQHGAAAQ